MWTKAIIAIVMACCTVAHAEPLTVTARPFTWQQISGTLTFHVFAERELYTTLDRTARVVIATEAQGAGHALEDLSANWTLTAKGDAAVARGQVKLSHGGVDLTLPLAHLPLGDYQFTAQLIKANEPLAEQTTLLRHVNRAAPSPSGRIALRLPRGQPFAGKAWPVQAGVPFPKGALWNTDNVSVVDGDGNQVDAGVVVRSRWGNDPHASIRWLGVDFQAKQADADWPTPADKGYAVVFGNDVKRLPTQAKLQVTDTAEAITIDTGAATLQIKRGGFNVLDRWTSGNIDLRSTPRHGLYVVDHEGTIYRAANDRDVEITIEEQTDMRVVIRAAGWYVRDRAAYPPEHDFKLPTDRLCRFITRIEAYAGQSQLRVMNTLILTFDTFNVHLIDAGMTLPTPGGNAVTAMFGIEGDKPITQPVDQMGTRAVQHLHDALAIENGQGKVLAEARRSAGWAIAQTKSAALSLTLRDLWQRYPKEIEVKPDALVLHVWPKHGRTHPEINEVDPANMHKLLFAHQGKEMVMNAPWDYFLSSAIMWDSEDVGVYKPTGPPMAAVHTSGMGVATTSDVMLELGSTDDADTLAASADTFMLTPHASADPKWVCDSLAVGYIHPYDPEMFPTIETMTANLMRGYWDMQEWGEMYGMWIYRSWLHSNYLPDKKAWNTYRLYNGTHHHEAPIPWLLFARSADPFYLTQGMANIRQLTDVQMIHHADPGYTHKEFHSHQMRLVGSTKHDNSISPWGNDHGILGHLCAYNGAILAYYMTGDLRLREVVVDEWQNTLLTRRDDPEYAKADRSNTDFKTVPRDNSTAIGDILDVYQLTYDPRLLALLAPRLDIWLNVPGCMGADWGQPMHNLMLFHGSSQANRQLLDGAAALVAEEPSAEASNRTFARPIFASTELLSLANILEPDAKWAAYANSFDNQQYVYGVAWNRLHRTRFEMHCKIADYTLYLPRLMYALANSNNTELTKLIGQNANAPRHTVYPTRVVVRKERDEPFNIYVTGHVTQKGGFDVRVFAPDGTEATVGHVDPGYVTFSMTVPSDGRTGDYVIAMGALQHDDIIAPYTSLPEVYTSSFITGNNGFQRLFTRSSGEMPEVIAFTPHKGPGTILSTDEKTVLAQTETGETMTPTIGPQGAWVLNRSGYIGAARETDKPVIYSINPSRWFMPSPEAMALDIGK